MAAQDARQHDDGGLLRSHSRHLVGATLIGATAPGPAAHAAGRLTRVRQRADRPPAQRRILGQRVDHRLGGALVGEVVEMRDLAALVEHEARAVGTRDAAVHRAGLHHQVVVGPVERVGHQRLQPRADTVAFEVAGDHAQGSGHRLVGGMQPAHQRAVGHHRRDPGQLRRIGAPLRDAADEIDQFGQHRNLRQVERPLEDREVGIEALTGQQGATGRTRRAHDAVDDDAVPMQVRDQQTEHALVLVEGVLQLLARGGVEALDHVAGQFANHEQFGRRIVELTQPGRARQHLGHQPAARMRDQVQPSARRTRQRQRVGVLDRAFAQRRVVQRVDAVAVVAEQGAHPLWMLLPELAEAARRFRERAVHEHQRGPAVGRGGHHRNRGLTFQPRQHIGAECIDALDDLTVDALDDLVGREVLRPLAQRSGDDFQRRQQHVAEEAAGRAAGGDRMCFQTLPPQLGRHRHFVGSRRRLIGSTGATRAASGQAGLRQHQVASSVRVQHQRRPVGDVQHDDVDPRHRLDPLRIAGTASGAEAHRRLDGAAQPHRRRHRLGSRCAAAPGGAIDTHTGNDEGDGGSVVQRRGHGGSPGLL